MHANARAYRKRGCFAHDKIKTWLTIKKLREAANKGDEVAQKGSVKTLKMHGSANVAHFSGK